VTDNSKAPERIFAWEENHNGFPQGAGGWIDVNTGGRTEYVRADLFDAMAQQLADARAERDAAVAGAYEAAAKVLDDECDLARIALPQAVPVLRADARAIRSLTPADAKAAQARRDAQMMAHLGPIADLLPDAVAAAEKAIRKYPQPNYVITKWAEETGEVTKDLVHMAEGRQTAEKLRGEIVQALAMLHRLLIEGDQVHGLPPLAAAIAACEVKP